MAIEDNTLPSPSQLVPLIDTMMVELSPFAKTWPEIQDRPSAALSGGSRYDRQRFTSERALNRLVPPKVHHLCPRIKNYISLSARFLPLPLASNTDQPKLIHWPPPLLFWSRIRIVRYRCEVHDRHFVREVRNDHLGLFPFPRGVFVVVVVEKRRRRGLD